MSPDSLVTQSSNWFANNEGLFIQYAVNLIAAILIVIAGNIAARVISRGLMHLMEKRKVDETVTIFSGNLLKYLILTFFLIAALGRIGVQTASFVAVVGAAGLAVGLALQGSLSNFAAGVLLILFRPYKKGEFVEIAGVSGSVEAIQIFTSVLYSPDNKMIVVPNANVLNNNIINYTRTGQRRVDLQIGVSYSADLNQTRNVIEQVLQADKRVLKDPAITIGVAALADSSVNYVVRPWVRTEDYWGAYFELTEAIKVALDQAGIEIPFPQQDVHLFEAKAPTTG